MTESRRRRWPVWFVPVGLGGVLLVYLLFPFATFLASTGPADVLGGLATPAVQVAVRNSVVTATISTVLSTALGVPLALVLARRSFTGKRLVEALVVLPIVLPPVVGGAMLLTAFGRFTPIGAAAVIAGIPLTNSLAGIVLAQTFVAGPSSSSRPDPGSPRSTGSWRRSHGPSGTARSRRFGGCRSRSRVARSSRASR